MIERHKTAILRHKLSRPLALAQAQGLLRPQFSVLDYGCGKGEDVEILLKRGTNAIGWDPYFNPGAARLPADVVNLGYVLNVVEDLQERKATLQHAFALAMKVLVVSVRVDHSLDRGMPLSDGVVTSWGAFQKLYTQAEFRAYLIEVLGITPIMASLGIAYIFKDAGLSGECLVNLAASKTQGWREDAVESFRRDRIAQRFMKLTTALGRLPLPDEFSSYSKLIDRFGPAHRIIRLVSTLQSAADIAVVQNRKRDELLVYMAVLRLQGTKTLPLRALPPSVQADIKSLWPTYQAALKAGDEFLFQLGKPDAIRAAITESVIGKLVTGNLYFHRSYSKQAPPLLRLLLFAAKQIVGEVEHDVVKFSLDGRQISFLSYPDFDEDGHPALRSSVKVHLPTATYSFRHYDESGNPPILHRKETLVEPLYPGYAEFKALTEKEEELGLLSRDDIGFRRQWEAILADRRLKIVGHQLQVQALRPSAIDEVKTPEDL